METLDFLRCKLGITVISETSINDSAGAEISQNRPLEGDEFATLLGAGTNLPVSGSSLYIIERKGKPKKKKD